MRTEIKRVYIAFKKGLLLKAVGLNNYYKLFCSEGPYNKRVFNHLKSRYYEKNIKAKWITIGFIGPQEKDKK